MLVVEILDWYFWSPPITFQKITFSKSSAYIKYRGRFRFWRNFENFTKFWGANKDRLSIKDRKISEIDEDYLLEYFNCAVQRGKYGTNRLMGTIRMLINWEIRRKKYHGPNPVKIIKGEEFLWSEEEKDYLDF